MESSSQRAGVSRTPFPHHDHGHSRRGPFTPNLGVAVPGVQTKVAHAAVAGEEFVTRLGREVHFDGAEQTRSDAISLEPRVHDETPDLDHVALASSAHRARNFAVPTRDEHDARLECGHDVGIRLA